jgi:hypothetical protein
VYELTPAEALIERLMSATGETSRSLKAQRQVRDVCALLAGRGNLIAHEACQLLDAKKKRA